MHKDCSAGRLAPSSMTHPLYLWREPDNTVLQHFALTIVGVNVKMYPSGLFCILWDLFHEGREPAVVEIPMPWGRVRHGDEGLDDYSMEDKIVRDGESRLAPWQDGKLGAPLTAMEHVPECSLGKLDLLCIRNAKSLVQASTLAVLQKHDPPQVTVNIIPSA